MDTNFIQIGLKNYLPEQMTVMVTGAASGIGAAQTDVFLKKGHSVFAIDILCSPRIDAFYQTYPESFNFYQADLASPIEIKKAFDAFTQAHQSLHVLCNTAGILDEYKNIQETSCEDWQLVLQTNLYSMFYLTKLATPYLINNPSSRIINMASIASLTAGGGGLAYTASKHAIAGLTKQMAYDYSEKGLRVNAIAPGAIATEMNRADFKDDQKMAKWVADQTPSKRWATAEEVAELTLFLASNAADYIQGTIIPLDGGWLIR